ncbi:MAG: PilN domain-containing protein [Parcubacteria group bacterium]
MTNINLATSSLPQKQGPPYKKGIISIAVILIILAGGYLWLTRENNKTAAAIGEANNNYQAEYQKLTTSNREIVDFQNRVLLVKDLLAEKNAALDSFPELEKNVLPGAYLTSYDFKGNNLSLNITTDNFNVLARQVASFKNSGFFSAVSVGKSSLDDKNKVVSDIVLKIN